VLVEAPGTTPRLFFQHVPEPKSGKNRVHLDLHAEDHDAELRRLVELGAAVSATFEGWTVLSDPEGNELCLRR
jgi:hypothetical protein